MRIGQHLDRVQLKIADATHVHQIVGRERRAAQEALDREQQRRLWRIGDMAADAGDQLREQRLARRRRKLEVRAPRHCGGMQRLLRDTVVVQLGKLTVVVLDIERRRMLHDRASRQQRYARERRHVGGSNAHLKGGTR
jgi:hypothetical protein